MVSVGLGTIGIAVLAVLVLAGIAYWIRARALSSRGGDSDARKRDSAQERVEHQEWSRDATDIGVTSRVTTMTTPAKFALTAFLVLFGVITWGLYDFLKTGSPAEFIAATWFQVALGAMVALGMGIAAERRRQAREGRLHLVIEGTDDGDSTPQTKTVFFSPGDETTTEKGRVVTSYQPSLFLGWFRNPQLVADDRELRRETYLPLVDKVMYQIPDNAVRIGNHEFVTWTRGTERSESPAEVADYVLRPPWNLSQSEYLRIQSDMDLMQQERNEMESRLARAEEIIDRLHEELETDRSEIREEVMEEVERIGALVRPGRRETRIEHQPREGYRRGSQNGESSGDDALDRLDSLRNRGDN
jgi:hypothetical protein